MNLPAPHPTQDAEEFHVWTLLYLGGDLPEDRAQVFRQLLESSPEARLEFARIAQFDADLYELRRSSEAPPVTTGAGVGTSRRLALRVTKRRVVDKPLGSWGPALTAAGILFGLVLLSLSSSGPSPSGPGSPETARRERARAREARREAEERLTRLREEEQRAEQAKLSAAASREEDRRKKSEDAFTEILRKRIDEEARLAQLREAEKRAEEATPKTAPQPVPPEKPAPPPQHTQVAIATFEKVEGAFAVTAEGKTALKGGEDLLAGQGVDVGEKGVAVIRYSDKTRLEIGSGSEIREFRTEGGKRLFIARGTVGAKVERQPKGQEMVFATPHGDSTVLGTTLRLIVDPDPKKGTRLEVEEGKVQVKKAVGKTVDVPAGHFAVAAAGVELKARPISGEPGRLLLRFDFEDGKRPSPWAEGEVQPGPRRAGNRFCLAGTEFKGPSNGRAVRIGDYPSGPLPLKSASAATVTLDCWIGAGGKLVTIAVWNKNQQQHYLHFLENFQPETWTRLTLPLKEFRPERRENGTELGPQDEISVCFVWLNTPGVPFYVDNFEFRSNADEK